MSWEKSVMGRGQNLVHTKFWKREGELLQFLSLLYAVPLSCMRYYFTDVFLFGAVSLSVLV